MQLLSLYNILYAPLIFIFYKIVSSKLESKRQRDESRRRGCLPPPTLRSNNLLGTQILKESIKAQKEDRGPKYVVESMDRLGKHCHTIRVPVIDYELIVTRDPENVKVLFQSSDFDISETRSKSWMPLLGRGIFTGRGEVWKHSRALVRPQFTRDQISSLELEESHSQALLNVFETGTDGWTDKVDLAPLFYRFTLDTATEMLYGESVHSQTTPVTGEVTFGDHIDFTKHYIDERGALAKFYWIKNSKEFKWHCAEVHKHVDAIVAKRLISDKKAQNEKRGKFILLDALAEQTQDPLELRNETLHILTAARDPTAALLGWVFYFLARHPIVVMKLRAVIVEKFGAKSEGGDMAFDKLRNCEYLQWVINESLRMGAVIPLNERVAVRDTQLPRGGGADGSRPVFIPKGNQVLIPKYAMQHRADIWGDNVEGFVPERWEGRRAGFEFSPFGGGSRKCIGQQFGQTEAAYLIVRFLQKFDAVENLDPEPIRLHHAIENRSGNGVQVKLHVAPLA